MKPIVMLGGSHLVENVSYQHSGDGIREKSWWKVVNMCGSIRCGIEGCKLLKAKCFLSLYEPFELSVD